MNLPFLRIPPFPGHRAGPLVDKSVGEPFDLSAAAEVADLLRHHRVGGTFWGAQPILADDRLLLAPCSQEQAREMLEVARAEGRLGLCILLEPGKNSYRRLARHVAVLSAPVDPWHLTDSGAEVWVGADHELALVSAICHRPVRLFGQGRFADCMTSGDGLDRAIQLAVGQRPYHCPFTGAPILPAQAIETLGEWRRLIDSNRGITAIVGVAGWKRPTVDPLLWNGSSETRHSRRLPKLSDGKDQVVVWKSRTSLALLQDLDQSGLQQAEIEDGMIRGRGLGANCIPPLSVVVDSSGIYFDPSGPSDLERILQTAEFDDRLLNRAARLRKGIIVAGISKYDGGVTPSRRPMEKRQILVVGQVEDDRSILSGGRGQSNLELLQRARSIEPNAWLIYRPHPDVEAGHRNGRIPDETVLRLANEVERGGSVISLIEAVDEVHCITSLAGFEALVRGKPVTTHGAPFYAGWGLTKDLGKIPARRNRRLCLDELLAATLIVYPRYLDPVTRLPCPPEVLLERLASDQASVAAPLAGVRKLQGKAKLTVRRLLDAAA